MAAGEALPDDFDYEDFVDDDEDAYEDDEEQDANYVSPLDDMDPFAIFKATVQGELVAQGACATSLSMSS